MRSGAYPLGPGLSVCPGTTGYTNLRAKSRPQGGGLAVAHIKPIETVYNGCRFRSRLEARWAVFFDALGIDYEYETEGYDLGRELGWYLPDFYLPTLNYWVEIKPIRDDLDVADGLKLAALSKGTHKNALMILGQPQPEKYGAIHFIDGRGMGADHFAWLETSTCLEGLSLVDHRPLGARHAPHQTSP
jgi:hypothetical protein